MGVETKKLSMKGMEMFGFFTRKKKPKTAMDELNSSMYGNLPPTSQQKRASVKAAVELASGLLQNRVGLDEIRRSAIELGDGPSPYSTHDLALSVALNFFKDPKTFF